MQGVAMRGSRGGRKGGGGLNLLNFQRKITGNMLLSPWNDFLYARFTYQKYALLLNVLKHFME